jgi:hypothetical protein
MSRWAEAFAALSRASDTLGTMRHFEGLPGTVSQSVESVTATSARSEVSHSPEPMAASSGGEAKEERAAVIEYDGAIPRTWAEGFARLNPDRPPGDVPPKRWKRFIDDVGRFLDSPFCAVATALGWGPFELFGCDRDRPFARIDRAGLLWLLDGSRVVALAENTATVETPTSARQTWHRRPLEPGRVLVWELTS